MPDMLTSASMGIKHQRFYVIEDRRCLAISPCDATPLRIGAEFWKDEIIATERFAAGRFGSHPLTYSQGYEPQNSGDCRRCSASRHSCSCGCFLFCTTASARARNRPRWRRWSLAKRATWRSLRVRGWRKILCLPRQRTCATRGFTSRIIAPSVMLTMGADRL